MVGVLFYYLIMMHAYSMMSITVIRKLLCLILIVVITIWISDCLVVYYIVYSYSWSVVVVASMCNSSFVWHGGAGVKIMN